MKLNLDPMIAGPRHVSAAAEALSVWYDANPAVRRLWAIEDSKSLRVIVTLEPTMDNGDTTPVWLASRTLWEREIHASTGRPVQLELVDEPPADEIEVDVSGEIVAAVSWRDPSSFWKAD